MPTETLEAVIASHLRTATHHPMDEHMLATYLSQWKGEQGKERYLRQDARLDEEDTADFESLLPSITVPVRVIWGENDAWLPAATAARLRELIPGSDLVLLPETGHLATEDSPQQVAATLFDFFTDCGSPVDR